MNTFHVGRINKLKVLRQVSIGAYLQGDENTDILIPKKYLPEDGVSEGDLLDVFIYHDNEGRLIATTLRPYIQVGEVGYLKCVSTSSAGAFVDLGIHKDLFVPFSEQNQRMEEGLFYSIFLYIDGISGRMVGSAKLNKHIGNTIPIFEVGEEVGIYVANEMDLGWRCVVNHKSWGMVYKNEVKTPLNIGSKHLAYVVRIREDDKIDLSIEKVGYARIDSNAVKIHRLLHQNGGQLNVGDKSSPETIEAICGMSKKVFKQAIGSLYKKRVISISEYHIRLTNDKSHN